MAGPRGQSEGVDRELALLINSVADYAIFLLDVDGHVLSWNRGAERIQGYRADEIVGQHFSVFYTPEDRERHHPDNELRVALRDGRFEGEGWRVRKDGTRLWASVVITVVRDEDGRHIGFGKVTRDLTSRRLAEDRLRENAEELRAVNAQLEQFRRLVASVRDYAIFLLDPHGHVATWNAGAEHLKGYRADEIIGRHFSIFYTQPDLDREHCANELAIAAREGRYEEEGWRVRKDGSTFWASVTITAVRDDDGELLGFAKVTRDLTSRRDAEEALRAANQELDRFATVAAHDLNDPLRTISGFADLLVRENLGPPLGEYVGHIAATTDRMRRLVDNLLEYARAGEAGGPPVPVPVAPAARHVLASLAGPIDERGAQLDVRVPDEAVVLAGDSDVEVILQNLVANAIKFADPERPRVEIHAAAEGDAWRIEVADNGVGIDGGDRERIFEAFERAHAATDGGGTGLGLAICERLVRRHAGRIGVDSAPGQGSRFWVLLPAVATA